MHYVGGRLGRDLLGRGLLRRGLLRGGLLGAASSRPPSWPAPSSPPCAAAFLAGPRARRSASSSEARSSVIDSMSSPLRSDALVSPSVTYGPKRPSLITILASRDRVLAELAQRRGRGGAAAALLGLGQDRGGLVEGDREQLLLGLDRARVGALLDVRAVAAVLRGDVLAVELAERARQRQQLLGLLEGDRVERHRLEQRRRLLAVGDVRAVAPGLGGDLAAVGGRAELAVAGRRRQQLLDLLGRQLVGGEVLGQRGARSSSPRAALQVRAVAADAHDDVVATAGSS